MNEILERIEKLSYRQKQYYKKMMYLFSCEFGANDSVLKALNVAEKIDSPVVVINCEIPL